MKTIMNHRSVRHYTGEPIPEEHIRLAVEAGQQASTSSAVQGYCLIRVNDPAKRVRLVELVRNQKMVGEASAFFAVCGDARRHRLIVEASGREYDARLEAFLVNVIDASLFAQNVALAFESMGYGMCYIGSLRNQLDQVVDLLNIPVGVYPLFGLCIGNGTPTAPDAAPFIPRPRLPLDAVYFEDEYPSDETMMGLIAEYDERYREYLKKRGTAPKGWSESMTPKYAKPRRVDLSDHYRALGAKFD